MCDNTEKIKASKGKFLDEMQLRFQKLVDAQRKLRFSKQKLLEDLDYQVGVHFEALDEGVLVAALKLIAYF